MSDDTIEPDVFDSAAGGVFEGTDEVGAATYGTSNRGTLDETIYDTLKRDVMDINTRLRQVVYPHFFTQCYCNPVQAPQQAPQQAHQGVHCDLWAPLTFILVYAISLSRSNTNALFSTVFVSQWFVLLIMAVHLRLMNIHDGNSLLSYISISGYCLFPLVVNNLLAQVILPLLFHNLDNHWLYRVYTCLRLLVLVGALFWSIAAVCSVTKSTTLVQTYPLALCLAGIGSLSIIS